MRCRVQLITVEEIVFKRLAKDGTAGKLFHDWTGDCETLATNGRLMFLGCEECQRCQTVAVDGPEELKPVDKTHLNTMQILANQHGGFEYNSLTDWKPMQIAQSGLMSGQITICRHSHEQRHL